MESKIRNIYRFEKDKKIINQGDLYANVVVPYYDKFIDSMRVLKFPYFFILSQDCDLDWDYSKRLEYNKLNDNTAKYHNKFLPSILVCPAFNGTKVREGSYLEEIYNFHDEKNFNMNHLNSKLWNYIKTNQNYRYHYIKANDTYNIPELCLDFKQYFTVPRDYFYEKLLVIMLLL